MSFTNLYIYLVLWLTPFTVLAAPLGLDDAHFIAAKEGLFERDISEVIQSVILWLMGISTVIALAALIYSGFLYITAFTNEKNAEKAKTYALYAIIGLIIIGASFTILRVIQGVLVG